MDFSTISNCSSIDVSQLYNLIFPGIVNMDTTLEADLSSYLRENDVSALPYPPGMFTDVYREDSTSCPGIDLCL